LIEVVMFMETEFSVVTELDDLEMANFLSVDNMARFVTERRPATSDAGFDGVAGERVAAVAGKGVA
jgi:hypothetical protein